MCTLIHRVKEWQCYQRETADLFNNNGTKKHTAFEI